MIEMTMSHENRLYVFPAQIKTSKSFFKKRESPDESSVNQPYSLPFPEKV